MRKGPISLLLSSALLLSACAGGDGGNYFAPTAALVCGGINCVKIPESRVSEQLTAIMADKETAKPFRGPGSAENRVVAQREILSGLIRDEVALQRARRMNITTRSVEPEAASILKDLKAQFPSEKAFNQQLKTEGISLKRLKEQLLKEAMLKKVQDDVGKNSAATPEEIEQFYNLNKSQYSEQVNISHILICGNLNAQERVCSLTPEDEKRTSDALTRARAGEDFGALAREYSADESSKAKNGEVGFISRGDLVPELEDVAFGLVQPGDISDPVKSQFGLHIVKLNKVGKPLEEARDDIEEGLSQRKLTKAFDEWLIEAIKASRIKVNNKIGKYDPISQMVIALKAKKDAAPPPAPGAQPTDTPAEVPDPPEGNIPEEPVGPEAPAAPAP